MHRGKFQHVTFVIDDPSPQALPLNQLVYAGLKEAFRNDCKRVSLPLMRMGVAAGIVEKNIEQVAEQLMLGITQMAEFIANVHHNDGSMFITIVVYRDLQGKYKEYTRTLIIEAEKYFKE